MGTSATSDVDEIVRGLGDAVAVLEAAQIPYLTIGSIAAAVWGDVTWARERADIDFFVRKRDVPRALMSFVRAGFATDVRNESWLAKAHRRGVLIDLIFCAARSLETDDRMFERGRIQAIEGCPLMVVSPEDFVVMQSLTVSRETPDHLFNGVGAVSHTPLDWEYLLERAQTHEAEVLSLLAYAASTGAHVPRAVLMKLASAA